MSAAADVLVVSDLHCGSTLGLLPPEGTVLDDGGVHLPSPEQLWMWDHYTTMQRRVASCKDWYLLLNGDLVDGDHHGTAQIVSRHPEVQVEIAKACLAPLLALQPSGIVVIRGTEVHTGKSGATEEAIARQLAHEGWPVIPAGHGIFSHWHWMGEIGGVLIDATHHGRMGQRPWTKASVVSNLAVQIFYERAANRQPVPQIAVRSHFHKFVDTHDMQPVRVIQTPAFQLATAFVRRIGPEAIADIGGVMLHCDHGAVEVEPMVVHPAPDPIWRADAHGK